MDQGSKGYLQASDWGDMQMAKVVELFSLVYMQRFMGLPGPTSLPEQVRAVGPQGLAATAVCCHYTLRHSS